MRSKGPWADAADGLVLAGLVLLGVALGMWLGWPGALAYAGGVLVAFGLVLAARGASKGQ